MKITADAAMVCGAARAEKIAMREAAAETLRRGYDRFKIVSAEATVNAIPTGGALVLYVPSQGLVAKMFKNGDPAATGALSARETLGPDWREQMNKTTMNCL